MASSKIPLARRTSTTTPFSSAKHGTIQVPNPYDWLEDTSSPETKSFIEAQNSAFSEYLNDEGLVEAKQRLTKNLMDMWQLTALPSLPQVVGEGYIFRVLGRGREFGTSFWVSKASVLDRETVLEPNGTNMVDIEVFHDEASYGSVLMASSPSRSGKYWAFTTSDAGSDWGIIRIKDLASGKILDDEIRRTKFSSKPSAAVPWLGDRGFFYHYYPDSGLQGKVGRSSQLRFHEVGRPQDDDEIVYEDPGHPGYTFKAAVSDDDRSVFLESYDQGRGCQIRAAMVNEAQTSEDNAGDGNVASSVLNLKFELTVFSDWSSEKEYIGTSKGAHLFWSNAENGKVIAWKPRTNKLEEVVVPHERQTLKLARLLCGGRILAVRSVDVRDQIQIFSSTGEHLQTLDELPLWTILDASFDSSTNTLFLLESAFRHPPGIWHAQISAPKDDEGAIELTSFKTLSLFPEDTPLTGTLSTTQVFYPSRDSTQIPMFLTSAPLATTTPSTPILLYIYGGLGVSVIPHFRPDFLTFLSTFGGILAVANIRGGGEYGAQWYQSACKENRQRLFDDIIAAASYLREKFGDERKIVLMGESMGGLNAATAMTQAPGLFDAVIINAGVVDILHRQRVDSTGRGVQDLGDVNDPVEFDFIHQWSPMEKVLATGSGNGNGSGGPYPPVLLTAGDKDDFVNYSQSLKMAAALQYAASRAGEGAGKGTHLRIISNLGHGGNISAKQKAAVGLERWLWVKKTLGLAVFGS